MHLPRLTENKILNWADAYYRSNGRWPNANAGAIVESPGDTWSAIENNLRVGGRGLRGGSSLIRLLETQRGVRNIHHLPNLTETQILKWADAYFRSHGHWPQASSGTIPEAPGETWSILESALSNGRRGLRGGSSLVRFLAQHRGARNLSDLPALTEEHILGWMDAHHQRTGTWPTVRSGPIEEAPEENWRAINTSLRDGGRGLSLGGSLLRLLARHRGLRHWHEPPLLTQRKILAWADAHYRRTGTWPKHDTGPIYDGPDETWTAVDSALRIGSRGLRRSGSSLARLLAKHRGVRNSQQLAQLTETKILQWATTYHQRHGCWPNSQSGSVNDGQGTTWLGIDRALRSGRRGLPGGSSLAQLLLKRRAVRYCQNAPALTCAQILDWADAHHQRTGDWPHVASGPIFDAPGETWTAVNTALRVGLRGLRTSGSSLARLLAKKRGVRNEKALPSLTSAHILRWADAHHARTGKWPNKESGSIINAPGETWCAVHAALRQGGRGLRPGSSLSRFLRSHGRCG
jgi:hypothetical protein